MFIGHYGIALGAKRYAASVSLGALFLACQLADLIWPDLVLMGIEKVEIDPGNTAMTPLNFAYYPFSHSLLAVGLWSLLFAGLYMLIRRAGVRAAIVLALVVFSHWVLDFVTHRPDLPLTFSNARFIGLGLWNHPPAAIGLELAIFGIGVWSYARATRSTDRRGSIGLWALVAFLLLTYVANVIGPPPPSVPAVAWSAQAMWLLVLWGYWVDRHRTPIERSAVALADPGGS